MDFPGLLVKGSEGSGLMSRMESLYLTLFFLSLMEMIFPQSLRGLLALINYSYIPRATSVGKSHPLPNIRNP